jgi:hypothetical protein
MQNMDNQIWSLLVKHQKPVELLEQYERFESALMKEGFPAMDPPT